MYIFEKNKIEEHLNEYEYDNNNSSDSFTTISLTNETNDSDYNDE